MFQFDKDGNVHSKWYDVTIGVVFVVLAIACVIADIYTTKQILDAGLKERNKWFQDDQSRPVMWKVILFKSLAFIGTSIIAVILTYGYGAGYFAFFVYIGVFFVNGITAYNNWKLLKKHRTQTTPRM